MWVTGLWTGGARLCGSVQLALPASQPWVSDCLLAPAIGKLVVALMNRSLRLYDISSSIFDLQYEITALDHAAITLDLAMVPGDSCCEHRK